MAREPVRRSIVRVLAVVGVVLWVGAPLAVFGLLTWRSASASLEVPRPVYVEVERSAEETTRPVQLALQWEAGRTLRAPAWSGVVQEVLIAQGDAIVDGTPIARIDEVLRTAAIGEMPLTRQLGAGDSGADVQALHELLNARGYVPSAGDKVGAATMKALRAFAASIGVPRASSVTTFDPAWVVFLPEVGTADTVLLNVAAAAPGLGEVIVGMSPELLDAALVGQAIEVETSDAAPVSTSPIVPDVVALSIETLVLDGGELVLTEDRQHVAAESLPALTKVAKAGAASIPALLVAQPSASQWSIPSSAVIAGESGHHCVRVVSADFRERVVAVSIVMTASGTFLVDAPLEVGERLAVYPLAMRATC